MNLKVIAFIILRMGNSLFQEMSYFMRLQHVVGKKTFLNNSDQMNIFNLRIKMTRKAHVLQRMKMKIMIVLLW